MTRHVLQEARIVDAIVTVRGQRVIMASDLALLFGVPTFRLNEQVKRNAVRFPRDFCFQLTSRERDEVIANCDHLRRLKFAATLPLAFTEHGAIMAANVLNSPRAVEVSVQVVRAFMSLRHAALAHQQLAKKLAALARRYDGQFKVVFDALRVLIAEPAAKKRIGFQ